MEAIIFMGVQGSGKSSFYKEHFFDTHIRISLDLLRTHHRQDRLLQLCLDTQARFVVDNTNPLKEVRARFIKGARERSYKVRGYYFKTSLEEAIARNKLRSGKARIPEVGLRSTFKKMQPPGYQEGFDELFEVRIVGNAFVSLRM